MQPSCSNHPLTYNFFVHSLMHASQDLHLAAPQGLLHLLYLLQYYKFQCIRFRQPTLICIFLKQMVLFLCQTCRPRLPCVRLCMTRTCRNLYAFCCPCRSLFATLTRGSGMLHRAFQSYGHYRGPLDKVRKGVLIAMAGKLLLSSPECSSVVACQYVCRSAVR